MTSTAESLREQIKRALTFQKQKTVTVLSSLLAVQDEVGYIPEEAIGAVSHFNKATINDVWGVASFYTNFRFQPPGRCMVEICWGPTCHILGAMGVIHGVLSELGLDGEGTTSDGAVSLRFNTCLGACANGPVISVDHHLIGRITPIQAAEMAKEISDKNRDGSDGGS